MLTTRVNGEKWYNTDRFAEICQLPDAQIQNGALYINALAFVSY
jgi:hypothetical protein